MRDPRRCAWARSSRSSAQRAARLGKRLPVENQRILDEIDDQWQADRDGEHDLAQGNQQALIPH